jgi:tRNA (cmo5U34)-methyltransferase
VSHSVAKHLRIEIDSYDHTIRTFIGGYDEMLDQVVAAVRASRESGHVIELGAGTGALSARLLEALPGVTVELWDVDPEMMGKAAERLLPFGDRARFVERSFFEALPPADAIVASLALHHVRTLADKVGLYRAIGDALRPGGVFVNADITIPDDPALGRASYRAWAAHLVESGIAPARAWEHFAEWSLEDRYFSLDDELGAIESAGLLATCPWRRDPATVTVGTRR